MLFGVCSELYQKAMHRYMKLCPKPYMSILRANLDHDWEALVRSRPTGKWKETLALLATYTQQVHGIPRRTHARIQVLS